MITPAQIILKWPESSRNYSVSKADATDVYGRASSSAMASQVSPVERLELCVRTIKFSLRFAEHLKQSYTLNSRLFQAPADENDLSKQDGND